MSFSRAPCLDVSILVITGRRINSINLLIDHVWSCPNVLSKNISFLVSISLGQYETRCIKVSSLSSHSLQNLDISMFILLWWYARKFCPVIALINNANSVRHKLRMPLLLFLSAFFQKYLVASCFGTLFHLMFHSVCIASFIALFTEPHHWLSCSNGNVALWRIRIASGWFGWLGPGWGHWGSSCLLYTSPSPRD